MNIPIKSRSRIQLERTRPTARTILRDTEGYARLSQLSGNAKTGRVNVTLTTHSTCDQDCPWYTHPPGHEDHDPNEKRLCYALQGNSYLQNVRHMRQHASGFDRMRAAWAEAALIDVAKAVHVGEPVGLRLHEAGDSYGYAATVLARAVLRYILRAWNGTEGVYRDRQLWQWLGMQQGRQLAWTYTHHWRRCDPANWSADYDGEQVAPISVLASCETPEHVYEAHAAGWATAMVVERHTAPVRDLGTWTSPGGKVKQRFRGVACPAQTADVQCRDCGLCMQAQRNREHGIVVLFEVHGSPRAMKDKLVTLTKKDGTACQTS